MKTMKLIIVMAMLCIFNTSYAQMKLLKVGDTVPDIEITDILNYPKKRAKLSDFKGKLVILDYWSRNCSPCIAGMPKMDALQKKFNNQIVVLPAYPASTINDSFRQEIDSFWKGNPYTKGTALSHILDTVFHKIFGTVVSQYVWIDESRVLRAITNQDYVNEIEIKKVLGGWIPNWVNEVRSTFNFTKPMIRLNASGVDIENADYSIFSKYTPDTHGGQNIKIEKEKSRIRGTFINTDIFSLYYAALNGQLQWNWIVLETADSTRFFSNTYHNEWMTNNSYCYELSMSYPGDNSTFFNRMLKDLNHYFKLNARFELRNVPCLLLKRINKLESMVKPVQGNKLRGFHLLSIQDVVTNLNFMEKDKQKGKGIPVIDETGIKDNGKYIHLPTSVSFEKINEINQELKRYGLMVEKAQRKLKMFVISEIK